MDDIRGVDVETASEQLVHEILAVVIGQVLAGVDDSVHVSLHQISDDVYIFISRGGGGLLHVHQADDVLVVEELCGSGQG